jgi:hypothetical protein
MEKPGVPKTLEDLNDQPEKREVLQMLHSLNEKREQSDSIKERAEIKKQMLELGQNHDLIREAIKLLDIPPEEWRLTQAINAFLNTVLDGESR